MKEKENARRPRPPEAPAKMEQNTFRPEQEQSQQVPVQNVVLSVVPFVFDFVFFLFFCRDGKRQTQCAQGMFLRCIDRRTR